MYYDKMLLENKEKSPNAILYDIILDKTRNIINTVKMLRWASNKSNLRIHREKSKKEYIVGFGIKDIKTYFEFIIDSSKKKDYIYICIYDKYGTKDWRNLKVVEMRLDKSIMYSAKYSFKITYDVIYNYILYVFNNNRKKFKKYEKNCLQSLKNIVY